MINKLQQSLENAEQATKEKAPEKKVDDDAEAKTPNNDFDEIKDDVNILSDEKEERENEPQEEAPEKLDEVKTPEPIVVPKKRPEKRSPTKATVKTSVNI